MRCACDGAASLCNDGMQQTTCKMGNHATGNVRRATCNVTTCQNGIGMDKRQETTENARFATGNRRHARWVRQRTRDTMRLGTCVMQRATDGSQNMYQTRCDVGPGERQHTLLRHGALGRATGKQTTGNAHQTRSHKQQCRRRRKGQRARHHRKMCNRHNATCNAQQGKCNGRHAACNGKRQAKSAMQWTTCNT
jgi:hypothetical protein